MCRIARRTMTLLWKHHGWLSRSLAAAVSRISQREQQRRVPAPGTGKPSLFSRRPSRFCPAAAHDSSYPLTQWKPRWNSGTRFSPALARARYSPRRLRDMLLFFHRKRMIRVDGKGGVWGGGEGVLIDPRRPYRCSRVSVKSL